jgi:hypothetical protein
MSTYDVIRIAHIAVGTLALATFWTSGAARKGSPVHKASGKIYLGCMAAIVATALPMSAIIAASGRIITASFLAYLVVLVATSTWTSWRSIRDKRDFARYVGPAYRVFAWLSVGSGLAVLALGLVRNLPLFAGFSSVGILTGIGMLRFARRAPEDPRWWLKEHFGSMLGNGVATHIAFLAIGLPRLVPALNAPAWMYTAWFGPLAIALVARVLLSRKYLPPRAQSQRSSRTNTAPASTLSGNLAVGS